jgi:hypothetical protein
VAFFGPIDVQHLAALKRFADVVVVGGADEPPPGEALLYDVVVLRQPTAEECARVRSVLRPGGWLYAEVDRLLLRGRSRRGAVPSVPAALRTLRRQGYTDLTPHWHWPNFEGCTQIVPLGDRAAIHYALDRRSYEPGRKLQGMLARGLIASRLFASVVPHGSVIGRRALEPLSEQ